MQGHDVLFSSEKQDWETPPKLYNFFHERYNFNIDLSASAENTKCEKYFDAEIDALKQDWTGLRGWCNPQYDMTKHFIQKAATSNGLYALLVPSRTDLPWFHDYVLPFASEIWYLRGRVRFVGATNSAPFPSLVVVYGSTRQWESGPTIHALWHKNL